MRLFNIKSLIRKALIHGPFDHLINIKYLLRNNKQAGSLSLSVNKLDRKTPISMHY
jgi:hypothetical protein